MTRKEFLIKHGPDRNQIDRNNFWNDLLSVLEEGHLARQIPKGPENANLCLTGAAVFLNRIAGYEEVMQTMRSFWDEPKKLDLMEPDTFQEPEV